MDYISQISKIVIFLAVAIFVSSQTTAFAATATGTLSVSANIASACTVNSANSTLNFAGYTGAVNDAVGSVALTCTNTTAYTIVLGIGAGTGASYAARQLSSSSNLLAYNLYTTAARSTVWGDGTSSTGTVSGTGSGTEQTVSVYGRIPAGQTSPPGTYTDSVSVTVSY